ncbi:hypothetical protein UPYG_G00043630 [Umbra pygmaea]|uniref:C-type lectin domain-containing protein n=1 Tax=Umbra pygmaea TaxID=75934 RepID=A0ABD0XQN4_UMBPY
MEMDDNIYSNMPIKKNGVGVVVSEQIHWWRRPAGVSAVCLGLLSVLLLTGIIGLVFYYEDFCHQHSTQSDQKVSYNQLQTSYDNLTKESEQLLTSYNTLNEQRDQLQTSYNTQTKERAQLQTSYNTLTKERAQLQTSYNTQTKERAQLQTSYNTLTKERDQLKTSYNTLTKERAQLQTSYNTLAKDSAQLQTSYNTLTKERDQLKTRYNTLTRERDQLQTSYNTLTKERDQLKTSYNTLTKEKDQLQTSYNTLTKERDQLKTIQRFYVKPCPEGWLKFNTSCYFITSTKDSAGAGQKACKALNGDLVVINSREEQLFIYGLKERVWIGIYKKEKSWNWVDSTPFTTTYWMEGEPDNKGGSEECVEVIPTVDPLRSWNDASCGTKLFTVCEKKAPTE